MFLYKTNSERKAEQMESIIEEEGEDALTYTSLSLVQIKIRWRPGQRFKILT